MQWIASNEIHTPIGHISFSFLEGEDYDHFLDKSQRYDPAQAGDVAARILSV